MVLGFSHTLGDECACRQYLNQSEELLRLHVATRTLVAVAKSVRGRHVALGYRRCCSMMPGQSEKSRRADGGPSMARELAVTLTTCSMLSIPADVTEVAIEQLNAQAVRLSTAKTRLHKCQAMLWHCLS